jgi:hypothetical protein
MTISRFTNSNIGLLPGKIVQIVRATDTTQRSTTSTTYTDASISVTITPQKSDSAILVIWSARIQNPANFTAFMQITDNSNNALSGAQDAVLVAGNQSGQTHQTIIGYSTPATTSATTYKGRFKSDNVGGTVNIFNNVITGQLYAIEVAA